MNTRRSQLCSFCRHNKIRIETIFVCRRLQVWIQDTRLKLLDLCKGEKPKAVAPTAASERNGTAPFVEDMYARIKDALQDYERVVGRWPQYAVTLENVSRPAPW